MRVQYGLDVMRMVCIVHRSVLLFLVSNLPHELTHIDLGPSYKMHVQPISPVLRAT